MIRTIVGCAVALAAAAAPVLAGNSKGALNTAEQTAAIKAVRDYALSYGKRLDKHMCTLTTRHTLAPLGVPNDPTIQSSAVVEQLSFVDGVESGGQETKGMLPHEFANLAGLIFDPATGADFHWDRTTTLDGRKVDEIAFKVPQAAGYVIASGGGVQVPFQGSVFAYAQSHAVVRIQMKCTGFPDQSAIRTFDVTVDYKAGQTADGGLMLPFHFAAHYVDSAQDRRIVDDGRYSAWH